MTDNEIMDIILADLKIKSPRNLITDILNPRKIWYKENPQRYKNILAILESNHLITKNDKYFPSKDAQLYIIGHGLEILDEFGSYSSYRNSKLDEKKEKIEFNIEGHGNVINFGNIINSTIENTLKLKEVGKEEVAKALNNLTNAVNEANDIKDEEKKKFLEQLNFLSEQALLDKDRRTHQSALEPIIKFGLGSLNATGSIASIWGSWGTIIKNFFLGQ